MQRAEHPTLAVQQNGGGGCRSPDARANRVFQGLSHAI